jgi:hypothetical protein
MDNKSKIYITLDYELFFGRSTGSVQKSLIEPTARLAAVGKRHNVAFTFFVDAGMLHAMGKYLHEPQVAGQFELVRTQLQELKAEGHSLQLHVHPHWEDMHFTDGAWRGEVSRYRLDQFDETEIQRIVGQYKSALESVTGGPVHAFRAGGWCIQPFQKIGAALKDNGIHLDSTLYRDGYMNTATHKFDFRGMPTAAAWRFEDDPMIPHEEGYFTEIPISTTRYSRFFYMTMVFHRLIKNPGYGFLGDGVPIGAGRWNPLRLLMTGDDGVVSLDGFRVRLLNPSLARHDARHPGGNFVAIGHPKAFCDQTFHQLELMARSHASRFAVM